MKFELIILHVNYHFTKYLCCNLQIKWKGNKKKKTFFVMKKLDKEKKEYILIKIYFKLRL